MCDCSMKDPIYIDKGDHWLVAITCTKCGKVIKQWVEPKKEQEK